MSRRGFTLIEVVLAIGLTAMVVYLLSTATELYLANVDASRTRVETAQLARTLLDQIAGDLANVRVSPPAANRPMGGGFSGAAGSQPGGGDPGGGAPTGGNGGSGDPSGSGSMGGDSIRQAKAALDLALTRLEPQDSFNVIEFNSHTRTLFPSSVPATPGNVEEARKFTGGLEATGGTEPADRCGTW